MGNLCPNCRRERNKIAATKCRNKKKERHTYLIQEGEHLTVQNTRLKDEIAKLQADKDDLMSILRYGLSFTHFFMSLLKEASNNTGSNSYQ